MNVDDLQDAIAGSRLKRIRNSLLVGILITTLFPGCGADGSETFVRFQVDGKSYEVKDASFVVTPMPLNIHLLELTYPQKHLAPGALIQWRMQLESPEQLVGQKLNLKSVDPNHIEPVAIFRITPDKSVQGRQHSTIHLEIKRMEEGIVEGSLLGKELGSVSKDNKTSHTVDVTAHFCARLVKKQWTNKVRSGKRSLK